MIEGKNLLILFYPTLYYLSIFALILSYTISEVIILKPLKEKISITIDSDLLERIKQEAEEDDRSLSQYINMVLKQHIRNADDKK